MPVRVSESSVEPQIGSASEIEPSFGDLGELMRLPMNIYIEETREQNIFWKISFT